MCLLLKHIVMIFFLCYLLYTVVDCCISPWHSCTVSCSFEKKPNLKLIQCFKYTKTALCPLGVLPWIHFFTASSKTSLLPYQQDGFPMVSVTTCVEFCNISCIYKTICKVLVCKHMQLKTVFLPQD